MSIKLFIDNSKNGYLAIDAAVLVEAFEAVLNESGLADRNDPAVSVVANRIIAFAKTSVLDSVRLRDLTVKAVRKERRPRLTDSPVAIPNFP